MCVCVCVCVDVYIYIFIYVYIYIYIYIFVYIIYYILYILYIHNIPFLYIILNSHFEIFSNHLWENCERIVASCLKVKVANFACF